MRVRVIAAVTIVVTIFLTGLIFSLFHTYQAVSLLKKGNITGASHQARLAQAFPKIISTIAFHLQPDLEVWNQSLSIIGQLDTLTDISKTYFQTALQDNNDSDTSQTLRNQLLELSKNLDHLQTSYQRSWILKRIVKNEAAQAKLRLAQQSLAVTQKLLTGRHTYLFLLQNSQELRATGGFMGSYALVTLNEGNITRLDIQDIYTADGQFTGFVEPPTGVKEYLSSGNGMRLPDANWSPDFPTSARQILSFFSLSNEQNIEGVIAINLPTVESLLHVTGPITIPDYQTIITADNFSTVARSDRSEFFPGSQQKQHFMSSFFNQFMISLQQLKTNQYGALFSSLVESSHQKNILFFSQDKQSEDLFEQLGLASLISVGVEKKK